MRLISSFILVVSSLFCVSASAAHPVKVYKEKDSFFEQFTDKGEIKIMSVNAHNLYDSKHDQDFFDYTYLPKNHPEKSKQCPTIRHGHYRKLCAELDWTFDRVFQKIGQLGKVIKGHGDIPDILALQEVENERVIAQLAKHTGYSQFVVTEFQNRRGVDLALLYKTRALEYIDYEEIENPGRASLRVHFKVKPSNKDLFVYVNHWVAQSAPTFLRVESAETIKEDIDALMDEYKGASVVLLGDFNTKFSEADEVFGKSILDKKWKHRLVEAHIEALDKNPHFAERFPEGTYWRGRNNWERYDRIFMSANLMRKNSALKADLDSYRMIYSTKITGEYTFKEDARNPNSKDFVIRYPLKFNFLENPKYPLGFTDHLPVTITLKN